MILRKLKLGSKLRILFLLVAFISTLAVTIFSIYFFSVNIKTEAVENMRKNLNVADLLYKKVETDTESFAKILANDNSVQLFTDLDLSNKLEIYLDSIIKREKYFISIIKTSGKNPLIHKGINDSSLYSIKNNRSVLDNQYIENAFNGKITTGTELINQVEKDKNNIISITSASPIYNRDGDLIAAIIIRNILNDENRLMERYKNILGVEAAIYNDSKIIKSTKNPSNISPEAYYELINGKQEVYEYTNINYGGILAQYKTIQNHIDNPVAVLGISIPADNYADDRTRMIFTLLIIMIIFTALSFIIGYIFARSILNPIKKLLQGVQKISSGDLSYEINTESKDEIGELSSSFDDMRVYLNEMIGTIERANGELERVNANLEDEVQKRTEKIETLLNKLKKYLSPQLYESLLGGKTDIGTKLHKRKKLTVFFSDIVSFTSTTESMEAEDLSNLLNTYLDSMAKIALKYGGTIDKFVGDAVMVFFGDPEFTNDKDHALKAVRMALEMLDEMDNLRNLWQEQGIARPLHIRIGINTGYCTVGNFGSENRMDYTIIGGNVNLASRLETAADTDTILISHDTYSLIKDEIQCEYKGELQLKGIGNKVKTYKVIREEANKQNKYLNHNESGALILKKMVIQPDKITSEQQEEMIKQLRIAIAYTQGKLKYVFDEKNQEWKLTKNLEH